jgi:hypothetical protein
VAIDAVHKYFGSPYLGYKAGFLLSASIRSHASL